jgi:hypothetical protein
MIAFETLVPPKTSQPEAPSYESLSYTATPVLGFASADTSATVRPTHPASLCQLGFGS